MPRHRGAPPRDAPQAARAMVGCLDGIHLSVPRSRLGGDAAPLGARAARLLYRRSGKPARAGRAARDRSEEHTSELQSLMRISYAVFCLKKKNNKQTSTYQSYTKQ